MNLAKDKYGRIGRKIPGRGFDAQVEPPEAGDRIGNVYLSPSTFEEEEAQRSKEEAEQKARKAWQERQKAVQKAKELMARKQHMEITQDRARIQNRDQALLADYFQRQMGMSEESKVARSLVTADFSESGADPQIVPVGPEYKGVWRADYRWEKTVGNPLSRDGEFGLGVTDFDRIVKGDDIHQWNQVNTSRSLSPQGEALRIVGGTMVGKFNDVEGHMNRNQMGFDWSWDSISSSVSDLADKTWDQLQSDLPKELAEQIQGEIFGSGGGSGQPGTVVVTRPVYQPVAAASQAMGVPPWAIYAGVGMIGIGLMFMMFKKA